MHPIALYNLLVSVFLLPYVTHAQNTRTYSISYLTPNPQEITAFTGRLTVPALPPSGSYTISPSLVPTDNSGILQTALTSESGSWSIRSDWIGTDPRLPHSTALTPAAGQDVIFSMTKQSDNFNMFINIAQTFQTNQTDLHIGDKTMNQATFTVALDGVMSAVGDVTFSDVEITAAGTNTAFCTDTPLSRATTYTVSGTNATVSGGNAVCRIGSIVLHGPM